MFVAPSPQNAIATASVPRSLADIAAPTATGRLGADDRERADQVAREVGEVHRAADPAATPVARPISSPNPASMDIPRASA